MTNIPGFKSVVFAGGGNRCLWQVGFWTEASVAFDRAPQTVTGSSAGSAMACLVFSGRAIEALNFMKKAMAANPRNVYWGNLFRGARVFPHEPMYRRAILEVIDDATLRILHQGPDIRVLLTRPPRNLDPRWAVCLGFWYYWIERQRSGPVHPVLPQAKGFSGEAVSVKSISTAEKLADLILASSCVPPITSRMTWGQKPVLDGGLVDNVPVSALGPDPGKTLVLLTRRYAESRIPRVVDRVYVQPSEPIEVHKWDYTDPDGLQKAYDLGRRDGEQFRRSWM